MTTPNPISIDSTSYPLSKDFTTEKFLTQTKAETQISTHQSQKIIQVTQSESQSTQFLNDQPTSKITQSTQRTSQTSPSSHPQITLIMDPTSVSNYVSPQNNFEKKERKWIWIYLLASIPSFVLTLIIAIKLFQKCKKMRNRGRRQRRSRIVRDLGMIQMSSMVNEQYQGPDDIRYDFLNFY